MKGLSSVLARNKRGQIQSIAPAILLLVFASVTLVFGLIILQEIRDSDIVSGGGTIPGGTVQGNDTAFRSANLTIIGLRTFADFWEIIVLAIVITVVIGLLLVVFAG